MARKLATTAALGFGPRKRLSGKHRQERRAGQMIAGSEQRVTQPARVVLRHELELERALVVAGGGLEQRLVRIGDDDGAEEAGVGGLVERPVEHRGGDPRAGSPSAASG